MVKRLLSIIGKYNVKHLLVLLVLFVSSQQTLKADHVMGADMSYVCLGSGKYKLIIKFYRDCRGAAAPTSWSLLYWYAGNNQGMSTSRYSLGMTRTGIRDITPRCSTASSPCSPTNTNYTGDGVEEHTYEASFDISKAPFTGLGIGTTYCDLTFAYNQCCRNAAITTGATWADFWTTATINVCNVNKSKNKCNTSPTLSNVPIGYACCNQAYYYNNGAIDTIDYDSLSYSMAAALSGVPNTSVPYTSPYSYQYPVTPYCVPPTSIKCAPNTKTKPPRGYSMDTGTGDLIFTPTKCDEVAVLVLVITEWRRDTNNVWRWVGKTRRDMQIVVKDDCGYNNAPTIEGPYSYKVCEGETIKFKVSSDDETFSPYQKVPDTTTMKWNKGIPGAKFTLAKKADWPEKRKAYADFEWTPSVGMASDVAYSFTVTVSDEHCPKPSTSIRAFKVKVNPRAFSKRTYTKLKCGRFAMAATVGASFKGAPSFKWSVRDSMGKSEIFYSTKKSDTMKFYRGGKYIIVHTVNNAENCPTIYRDTVIIPDPPQVIMAKSDTFACFSTTMKLNANVLFGNAPFKYFWTRIVKDTGSKAAWKSETHVSGDTFQELSIPNINRDSTLRIKITDGDGCIFYDTALIYVKPLPKVSLGPDQRICTYETVTFDGQNADTVKYLWSSGDTTRFVTKNVKGKYVVRVMEQKWKCIMTDTVELFVNDTVRSRAGNDTVICHQKSIELTASHKPAALTGNYTWIDITWAKTLGNNMKYLITPKNTNAPSGFAQYFYYSLMTKVTETGHECQHIDTIRVKVNTLPAVKWDPKPLKAQCFVYGDIEVNSFFSQGKDAKTRIWAFENKTPNNVNSKPTTSASPGPGFARNYIDSLTTGRHLFRTTFLNNAQLQNGNSFLAKIYAAYTDTNGCVNIDSVVQRINGNPMVDIRDSIFCQDLGSIKMDKITVRPKVKIGIKVDWTVMKNGTPGGVDPSKILSNDNPFGTPDWVFRFGDPTEDFYQGDYKFQLCVEDQLTGCLTCDSVYIKIISEPTVKVSSPNPVCVNWDTMELYDFIKVNGIQARDNDGSKYKIIEYNYNRLDPKVNSTTLIKGHRFLPSFGTGTWLIKYGNAATGCLKEDSFYIYVNDTPNAVLLVPTTICVSGAPLDLNTRINTVQTKPASATGVWTGSSVGVSVTGTSAFKPFSMASINNIEGPHSFRFTYTDNNGCSDTEVYQVFVRNQPSIGITTAKSASACEGSPFAIQSTSKYCDTKVSWTMQKHKDGSFSDGAFNTGNTSENVLYVHGPVDKIQKGAFLKVTTTPIAGDVCPPASDSIEIILHQYPDLSTINNQSGCIPLNTTWTVSDNRGIPSNQMAYRWDFRNGDTSNLQNPTDVKYPIQGKYNVRVIATNTSGNCKDTSAANVEAYPIPVASFNTDPTKTTVALPKFRMLNSSSINSSVFAPNLKYAWDFGDPTKLDDTSTLKNAFYSYGKDTATYTITLIVKSDKGCADTVTKLVYIGPDIIVFIPDAFTPDNAGPNKNNTFAPVAMNYRNATMKIFNRWGEKMYETNDLLKGWDGSANGADCQDGVYMYTLKLYSLDDKMYEYSGSISLLR